MSYLPYLNRTIPVPENNEFIGYSHDNYIRPDMISTVEAKAFDNWFKEIPHNDAVNQLKQARQTLRKQIPYGVESSVNTIVNNNPGVRLTYGDDGIETVEMVSPGAGGFHSRLTPPQNGYHFATVIGDDLDNLSALQVLSHEMGHYQMGHSTPNDYPYFDDNGLETFRQNQARNNIPKAVKEIEAELVAANVMNRLGYGYKPGVVGRSGNYISGWNNSLNPEKPLQIPDKVRMAVQEAAERIVPEPIRRFGPISTRIANVVKGYPSRF